MKLCTVMKDGYWCTLPAKHDGLHFDGPANHRFSEHWRHASGWHWGKGDKEGHPMIQCESLGCHNKEGNQ